MSPRKTPLVALVFFTLLAVTYYFWIKYYKPNYGVDDANIYFVYMRNFAEGAGFVWTPGHEKVEGFTSLLWTLIGSLFYSLSSTKFPFLLLGLNLLLAFLTIYRVLTFVRKLNRQENRSIVPSDVLIITMLFFPLGFIEWGVLSLMETGVWFFVIVHTTLLLCNQYHEGRKFNLTAFCILLGIMVLTRPEGLLFGPLFILIRFVQVFSESNIGRAFGSILAPMASFGLIAIGLISWRLSYFGFPFPNTYYAKVSASLVDNVKEGILYFIKFLYNYPHLALAICLLVVFLFFFLSRWKKEGKNISLSSPERIQLIIAVVVLAGLGVPVLTGGDHFKYSRFYQAFVPLMLVGLFNFPLFEKYFGSVRIHNRLTSALLTAALVLALFFIPKSNWIDFDLEYRVIGNKVFEDFDIARRGRGVADEFNRTFVAKGLKPSIGVIAAGGFAYQYEGATVDLMGLNNTVMAHASKIKEGLRNHASFDINGFWKLRPDVVGPFYGAEMIKDTAFVLPENLPAFRTTNTFLYKAYKKIFDTPEFIQTYTPALVKDKEGKEYLFAYYSNALLKQLDPAKFEVRLLQRKAPATVAQNN